jgi:hypothetical protein
MEMDRQTLFVIFGAIVALTLIGAGYLATPSRDTTRPVYAEEDIRHKVQQTEAKKNRRSSRPAPVEDDSSSDSYDADAEEPPAEEPTAEEPSIE